MTTVEVIEQVVSVVEVTETELVVQTVESVQVVELGVAGPQGPGVLVDELADRPLTSTEGALFAARDTQQFFIWF